MLMISRGLCPHVGTDQQHEFIVHCVSADGAMGAGFAKDVPNLHRLLFRREREKRFASQAAAVGSCIVTIGTNETYAHLVTKERHWHKPTIHTLTSALAAFTAENMKLTPPIKWHSPLIGCGLDRLKKEDVIPIVELSIKNMRDIDWEIHIP